MNSDSHTVANFNQGENGRGNIEVNNWDSDITNIIVSEESNTSGGWDATVCNLEERNGWDTTVSNLKESNTTVRNFEESNTKEIISGRNTPIIKVILQGWRRVIIIK